MIANAGTGGTPGSATVTTTTGTGTPAQIEVTIGAGGDIEAIDSILVAGAYTVPPTDPTAEPVTGGGLTGATLNLRLSLAPSIVASDPTSGFGFDGDGLPIIKAVGTVRLSFGPDGSGNTAVGDSAGLNNTGGNLTAVGDFAGQNNTGDSLTAVGYEAGSGNTGTNVIIIGDGAGTDNAVSNFISIGDVLTATGTDDPGTSVVAFPGTLTVDGVEVTEQGSGAATAVAGAATLNEGSGVITSEALVAATTYTLTLTNDWIGTTSTVIAIASNAAGGVVPPTVTSIDEDDGSVVIVFAMVALTGAFQVRFAVFN